MLETEIMAPPTPSGPAVGRAPAEVAECLARLYESRFAGRPQGKFRISRKLLRSLARRRKLPERFLAAVAEALFERGFVLVDLESHFAVLDQRLFNSYRRVNPGALDALDAPAESP